MNADRRLPRPWGILVDRDESVEFKFDGKRFFGVRGDTVSSALAANGCLIISRSFKYHRPRASLSFSGWDANSYVQIGNEPNVNGDLLQIEHGLDVMPQNVLGSAEQDFASGIRWLKPFLRVGFYYRRFYKPRGAWKFWERLIRRSAGLGRINVEAGRKQFCDKQYLFAEVVVIGSGAAGLAAATAAANEGASVLLVEESPVLGGALNYARFGRSPVEIQRMRDDFIRSIEGNSRIRVLTGTTCSGWFADNWLSLFDGARLFKVRASRVVLATGSVEQPAVFKNNDLPGVMTSSAVQRLMRLYGVRPGRRAVVIGGNADGVDVARDLEEAGVEIVATIDLFETPPARLEAVPRRGNKGVRAISFANSGSKPKTVDCDLIITSVGYAPLGQLACHDGGCLRYDDAVQAFRVCNVPNGGDVAGSANHVYDLDAVIADGESAGLFAASSLLRSDTVREVIEDETSKTVNHAYPIFPHPDGNEFVDYDEDQTINDLKDSVADGFDHPELAKRYSTVAMGPSQGRMSATNALRIVNRYSTQGSPNRQITTQRPPFRPVPARILAGQILQPERRTPMHDWHELHNATFMPAGVWQRSAFYGDDQKESIKQEVAAVRNGVGLIDVSTLGGIEIRGPDAAEFLNRMYTFAYLNQPVGRTRYLLMTDETGAIIDDGVAARLADDQFYVTTTSTGSDAVFREMQRRISQWRLRVDVFNATASLAAMNLAGPSARSILDKLDTDIDFSKDAFPFLGVRQGRINGIPVVAMRVGFVGEFGLELHVPSSQALELWETLFELGQRVGIRAVGVEAQRVLRLEKGHIIVGQDTDGLTNPIEAGMGWAVARQKAYFVGRSAIACFEGRPRSRALVGFELQRTGELLPEESNLVLCDNEIVGRVTSIACSESLEKAIGLAYVHPDDATAGSNITIKLTNGRLLKAKVVELPFLDPDNSRQEQ